MVNTENRQQDGEISHQDVERKQTSLEKKESISETFKGKNIFITGGTGFIGKVLIEKLLRDCSDLNKVYLLVRPNKGKQPEERVYELFDNILFSKLLEKYPNSKSKIVVVPGDLTKENMGIESKEQLEEIRSTVSFIFHCAASVNFNEELRNSLNANVIPLYEIINFAKTMTSLQSFIHLSTAYSQCNLKHIEEKFYPAVSDPLSFTQAIKTMSEEHVAKITPILVGDRPNIYTLTKSLAEDLLQKEGLGLPIAVVRPSIVGGIARDPIPGWCSGLNGPAGLYLAMGNGLLRAMVTETKGYFDIIPVDIVVNMMISVAWKLATNPIQDPVVYNCVSYITKPFPHKLHKHLVETCVSKFPLKTAMIKGSIKGVTEKQYKYIYNPLYHELPALLIDTFRKLTGQRPMFRKIVQRLNSSVSALTYFTTNSWTWDGHNTLKLIEELSESDRKTFKIDLYDLDWTNYLETYYQGSLKYVQIPKRQESVQKEEKKQIKQQSSFSFILFFIVVYICLLFFILTNIIC